MHPNAIVSEHASISQEAEIDPCTVVKSRAWAIGSYGNVIIGSDNYIQCGGTLASAPQDYNYKNGHTKLVVGDYK